jgi:hypothetical protein
VKANAIAYAAGPCSAVVAPVPLASAGGLAAMNSASRISELSKMKVKASFNLHSSEADARSGASTHSNPYLSKRAEESAEVVS